MHWKLLAPLALAAPSVHSKMLRFSCSQLVTERLDPIVNPGMNPSPHMHQITGGDAFNTTMSPLDDIAGESTCTTCTFAQDFSNYWTAVMYFKAQNGSFKRVPQIANQFLDGANGGMTVYYVTPDDASVNVTAFKPGFRMVVGTATARKSDWSGGFSNSYRCYTGKNFTPNPFGISSNDTTNFPTQYCAGGIRVATFFPTCWDGKNLDSPDHKSHVSYSYGSCPKDFPVQLPQVFFETVWDTGAFDKSLWPTDGSQPFVWSQGDGTGFGHHADYLFGWEGDSLQKAVDARCDFNCPQLKTQSILAANKCTKKQIVNESPDEWLTALPGSNPVTYS